MCCLFVCVWRNRSGRQQNKRGGRTRTHACMVVARNCSGSNDEAGATPSFFTHLLQKVLHKVRQIGRVVWILVVRLLRRARREARLASARKEEVIEVVLSSRLGRDARTASPQGRFAPSPSLSLSLSVSLGETETFVRKREEAGASPRSPGAQRILTMLPARLSVAVVSFLPLAPPGRFASITINSFSCSSLLRPPLSRSFAKGLLEPPT